MRILMPLKGIHISFKVENIEGKGENAGDQHLLVSPRSFQMPLP